LASLGEKMDAKDGAAYYWDFDKNNGLMMWEGSPNSNQDKYGIPGQDENLIFKIYKNSDE
jgi:hypothetical protein